MRTPSIAEIREFLVAELAGLVSSTPESIDPSRPISSYGMDSLLTLELVGKLETWLGVEVPDTLPWAHPTVDLIAAHLAGEPARAAAPVEVAGPPRPHRGDAVEPIAIVGMSGRFPGAGNLAEYWENLRAGRNLVTEVPAERWDVDLFYDPVPRTRGKTMTRYGGFLADVDLFDARFFRLSPREAAAMDPQQRLFLEIAWEAFEDAGIAPDSLAGSKTGVFAGVYNADYLALQRGDVDAIGVHYGAGQMFTAVPNRVSYLLGLNGPSMAVDTACSSSLTAIHLACESLRRGETTLALAGGVNLILAPDNTIYFSQLGSLAPDGRCKTFSVDADGYVRSEGAGAVVLKPLDRALADGDRIHAVVRGSATNHDGAGNGFTAPNPRAQVSVIAEALRNAGIRPGDVDYFEAHGTGTPLGDEIELEALGEVLREARDDALRFVGSVKTNIGHCEAAAGIAGVVKTVLALENAVVPPLLHTGTPSPAVAAAGLSLPVTAQKWPDRGRARTAGVSSFGLGGANAHVVLEQAPPCALPEPPSSLVEVFTLSAESGAALRELAARTERALAGTPGQSLGGVCHLANTGRARMSHRAAVVASSAAELREGLRLLSGRGTGTGLLTGSGLPCSSARVGFLFTGHLTHYAGMGRELYDAGLRDERFHAFRESIDESSALLGDRLGVPLTRILYGKDSADLLTRNDLSQPAVFATQVALVALWASWGILPSALLGHSLGEYAAAHTSGALDLAGALGLVATRGRLLEDTEPGEMWAVFAPEHRVLTALSGRRGDVAIAAVNGPGLTVVAGLPEATRAVVEGLAVAGYDARRLNATRAGHSPLLEPVLDKLESAAATVPTVPPQIPLVSNVDGAFFGAGQVPDAAYWARHAREPVRFDAGLARLTDAGVDFVLEIGPDDTLTKLAGRKYPDLPRASSLQEGSPAEHTLAGALAAMHVAGLPLEWTRVHGRRPRTAVLPTYPFERRRHWVEPRTPAVRGGRAAGTGTHPFLAKRPEREPS